MTLPNLSSYLGFQNWFGELLKDISDKKAIKVMWHCMYEMTMLPSNFQLLHHYGFKAHFFQFDKLSKIREQRILFRLKLT